jgi:DNA-binding transcriptional regulator YiaG
MPIIVEQRVINVVTSRGDDDLRRRKAQCSDFKRLLKKVHLSAKSFSELSLVPIDTVYSWTSKSNRCVPPNPTAVILLRLIDLDGSTVAKLNKLTSSEPS